MGKGAWKTPFDLSRTQDGMFQSLGKAKAPCHMMYLEDKAMVYAETANMTVVQLPYASGDLHANILLPKQEGLEALSRVIESLSTDAWSKLHGSFERENVHLV